MWVKTDGGADGSISTYRYLNNVVDKFTAIWFQQYCMELADALYLHAISGDDMNVRLCPNNALTRFHQLFNLVFFKHFLEVLTLYTLYA